jgi:N-acetylated-alpha-linked acidic dipeptidase
VGDLGSGSDYTPFFQHAGVPSTDIGSRGSYGVYHSVFDNYTWFIQNADSNFEYLQEMARVLGLEALHMADTDVLPYDYAAYARAISTYIESVRRKPAAQSLDFTAAESAAARLLRAAEAARLLQADLQGRSQAELTRMNRILRQTEDQFLSQAGLPNRPWYKHLIYAPGEYTGYSAVVIPGVSEALDARNTVLAGQQLTLLTQALNRAAGMLEQAR